jgi:hypothetical protein
MATFRFSNPFRMSHKTYLSGDSKVLWHVLSKQDGKQRNAWKWHGYEFVFARGHVTLACFDIIPLYNLPVYGLFSANAVNVFPALLMFPSHANYWRLIFNGQIAIGTNDVYKTADAIKACGGKIVREAGPLPGINTKITAILDPEGWKSASDHYPQIYFRLWNKFQHFLLLKTSFSRNFQSWCAVTPVAYYLCLQWMVICKF